MEIFSLLVGAVVLWILFKIGIKALKWFLFLAIVAAVWYCGWCFTKEENPLKDLPAVPTIKLPKFTPPPASSSK